MAELERVIEALENDILISLVNEIKPSNITELFLSSDAIDLLRAYQFINDWEYDFLVDVNFYYDELTDRQKEFKVRILKRFKKQMVVVYKETKEGQNE